MSTSPKILIVGAGAAGYAAACKLLEHGFKNVKLLEAENRIGGRIYSTEFGNAMVDLGAQWCHGEKNNIVYEMVKDLNLIQNSICNYKQFLFIDSDGNFIDSNVSDVLLGMLFNISNDHTLLRDQNGSLGEFIIKRYDDQLSSNYPHINRVTAKQIMDWYHKLENNLNASANWFEISAKGLIHYQDCEGDLVLNWKDRGYKKIFSVLKHELPDASKKLPIDEKIAFNKEVCRIIWDDYKKRKLKDVIVECSDGSQYKADHVIFTASLGVLKENYKTLFLPDLPSSKVKAIQGLSFGIVDKIFLKFPKKWWPDDCSGFDLVWKDEHCEKLTIDFPEGPIKNGKSWLEGIFGFHPIDCNPNVLLIFLNGECVPDTELICDEIIIKGCMYLLKRFLGRHFDIPTPDSVLRSYWYTNKNFRGSYSFRSCETERMNTSATELGKPLGGNNLTLLFAGEATHPTFYSTVHGAIESGYREANRIINHYRGPTSSTSKLRCKIAIIGAGIAGLAAATTLIQSGCKDILLLEAQEKPGGRIQSVEIAEGFIDLGAQWLHGNKNTLWKISQANNLLSNQTVYEGRGVFLREDGFKFDEFTVKKVNFIIGRILEDCESYVDAMDVPESVGKYLEEKFGDYLKQTSLTKEEMRLYLELYDWNVRFQVIDNCCDSLYNVSAKFWGRYFCPASEGQAHINYSNGHGSVVDTLVKELPINTLITNCPVTSIDWTMKEKTVKLTCQNSTIIETDAVIVTSSLGVLKDKSSKMFSPNLPNEMSEIIDAMGFAGICKIFLLFEERWWTSEEGFQLIWNYDHSYGDDWIRYLSGFDPVLDQPRMLLGWIGGRGAEIVESLTEEEVGKKCAEVLRKFTGNTQISNPIQVVRSRWSTNPWIMGGYSHTTPKCDERTLLPETLQQPIRDKDGIIRILFAGEHTHPEHFSTTHGAFESGLHQAQVLLNETQST